MKYIYLCISLGALYGYVSIVRHLTGNIAWMALGIYLLLIFGIYELWKRHMPEWAKVFAFSAVFIQGLLFSIG